VVRGLPVCRVSEPGGGGGGGRGPPARGRPPPPTLLGNWFYSETLAFVSSSWRSTCIDRGWIRPNPHSATMWRPSLDTRLCVWDG